MRSVTCPASKPCPVIGGLRARACARCCHVVVLLVHGARTVVCCGLSSRIALSSLQCFDKRAIVRCDLYYVSIFEYLLFVRLERVY